MSSSRLGPTPSTPSVPEPVEGPTTETLSHAYSYDNLGRLTRSEASDGETNTYGYDPAGNRTSWDVTGSPARDSQLTAQFNAAGQLTGTTTTGANAGTATYSFDGAGNRSSQTVNGESTSFGHDAAGRLLSTEADGRSTSYTYDGLDRRTSVTDETRFGSDTTGTVWDGFDPVATDSGLHGATDLLRDPTGGVVFQGGAYEDEWILGDMRNATATADASGQITDLVDYADFGGADYESTGWGSLVGNDGQPGDATLGLDHYLARDYDTTTGSWVQPDEWRGLLVRPQSLNRFAYVENSPVAFSDYLGYAAKRVNDGVKGGIAAGIRKAVAKAHLNTAAVLNVNNGANAPRAIARSDLGPTPNSRVKNPWLRTGEWVAQLHLNTHTGCAFSDWACRVELAKQPECKGSGRMHTCDTSPGAGIHAYSYQYDHRLDVPAGTTAEEAMRMFTAYPAKIFPFTVNGCRTLYTGAICQLQTGVPINGNGVVGVTTTSTSMKFTVIESGYFDAPGSTITFSTWTDSRGNVYLRQDADAHGTDGITSLFVSLGAARGGWDEQARKLSGLLQ